MAYINLIFSLIVIVLSLIGGFFGVLIISKCSGKLKISVILLVIAIFMFILGEIISAFNLTGNAIRTIDFTVMTGSETIANVIQTGVILLILFSLINMWRMIKNIEQNNSKINNRVKLKR